MLVGVGGIIENNHSETNKWKVFDALLIFYKPNLIQFNIKL